jgi:hypothetical protein
VFLDLSDSYFLFADLVGFYTHWTYMHIFLSNYWWQRSDIWSQASYRYPILWEAFFDPSDSYFLFVEERGYHRWALAHSSSCYIFNTKSWNVHFNIFSAGVKKIPKSSLVQDQWTPGIYWSWQIFYWSWISEWRKSNLLNTKWTYPCSSNWVTYI